MLSVDNMYINPIRRSILFNIKDDGVIPLNCGIFTGHCEELLSTAEIDLLVAYASLLYHSLSVLVSVSCVIFCAWSLFTSQQTL